MMDWKSNLFLLMPSGYLWTIKIKEKKNCCLIFAVQIIDIILNSDTENILLGDKEAWLFQRDQRNKRKIDATDVE